MTEERTGGGAPDTGIRAVDRETAASGMMLLSCLLLLAGAGLLSVMLIKLAVPTVFADTAFLSYGRLRPAAVSMLVYGFGGTLTQAAAFYLTPRLVGAPLRHQTFALLSGIGYGALVVIGVLVVLFRGPAEVVEGPALMHGEWLEIGRRMSVRYLGERGPEYLEPSRVRPRYLVKITPEKTISWEGVEWAAKYLDDQDAPAAPH